MKRPITSLVIGLLALFATHLAAQPTFTVSPQTITGNVGDQFTVDILASNFTNILSFQYSINWNSAAVQFNAPVGNVTPSALSGLTSASFGLTQSGSGLIGVSWSDPNATGVTIPDGTILFSLTFTILTSTGTNINFSGSPVPLEVVNGNGVDVTSTTIFQGASVNGGGSSGGGGGGGGGGGNGGGGGGGVPTGFAVLASDETAASGSQICVDITVQDFTNILSMQYTMEFDETKWAFASIPTASFGLPGLTAASFGTTQTGQGVIGFSWSDPNAVGVTVPNGTVIYQICFNAIGANNCGVTTPFSFNGTLIPIEVYNGNSQTVNFQSDPGALEICANGGGGGGGGGGGNTNLTFIAEDVESPNGSQVCVDFTADNFDCIVSSQFSIHFNQNIIQYISAQSFGLPDMTAANFGTTQSANGTIAFSWFDPTTTGVTVPDGTVIFQLCFNVIGANGQVANITFDGNPAVVEVTGCVNNQSITPDFDPGTVTVGVTCTGPLSVTSHVENPVACYGQSTGSINITVTGGSATKTYEWKNAAGVVVGTSQNLTNVPAGNYTVKITSCNGSEMATAGPYEVTQPATALHLDFTTSPVACFGETNGGIDITVTGGTNSGTGCSGYTYLWSNNATTQDLSGLAAGNYTVTVTDCKGCTLASQSFTVTAPSSALAMGTPTVVNIACNGGNNGSITITATGGGNTKEYKITPGPATWSTNNVFSGLAAGSYNAQVRDEFGCVKTTAVTITQPDAIVVTLQTTNPTPGQNNGAITANVTGGLAPFNYSWTGPNGPIPGNSATITGLAAGNYCVTVTDANACSKTRCAAVYAPMMDDPTNPSTFKDACAGQCNGSINVNVVGGVTSPPYTYAWTPSTVPPIANPTNLCPGTYTVTVTSPSIGQTFVKTFTINQYAQAPYAVAANLQDPLYSADCTGGAITLTPAGGSGSGYTFVWSGTPQTGNPISSLCEGTYAATITDGNGCTGTAGPYILDYVPDSLQNLQVSSANSCSSQSNGEITLSIFGGKPPYKYQISPPTQFYITNDNSYTFPNVAPGTYTYTITDSGIGVDKQTKTGTVTVNATTLTLAPATSITHATNAQLGSVHLVVTGGQGLSQNYQWNNGATSQDLFNVSPGCYSVTVTDVASGCEAAFGNIGVGLLGGTFSEVRPDCPQHVGSLTVTPTLTGSNCAVANLPYTYHWESTTIGPVSDLQTASNIPTGTYNVTIEDANGTSYVLTKDLTSKSSLAVTADVTSDYNGYDIRCFGGNGGEAEVFPSNGVPPYTYNWNTGAISKKVDSLMANTNYSVTVTDGEGCQMSATLSLFGPPQLLSDAVASASGCSEGASGQATVTPSGGVFPYTYHWSNGDKDKTADNLMPGETYSVTVTDFNGCTVIDNAPVPEVNPLTAVGVSVSDSGGPSGQACVVVTGGTWPYNYYWPEYETVADSCLTELFPDTYVVRITDANGCQIVKTIKVDDSTECGEVRTVITPEGDGKNEEFVIKCLSRFNDNTLEIYNRWGQLVYHTEDYNDDNLWRGTTMNGSDVPDGVYYYVFNYFDPGVNAFVTKKGSVTVIRK